MQITDRYENVVMLTTLGFRDLLRLSRNDCPDVKTLEALERVDRIGKVLIPLDKDLLEQELFEAYTLGARKLLICFMHSNLNPANEILAQDLAKKIGFEVERSSENYSSNVFIDRLSSLLGLEEHDYGFQDPELLEESHPLKIVQMSFAREKGHVGQGLRVTMETRDVFDSSILPGDFRRHIKWMETTSGERRIFPESFAIKLLKGERIGVEIDYAKTARFRKSPYFFQYDFGKEGLPLEKLSIHSEDMGRVALQGHGLYYVKEEGSVTSDVKRAVDEEVWGELHRLTSKDLEALESFNTPNRKLQMVFVSDESGQCIEAYTFKRVLQSREVKPTPEQWWCLYKESIHRQFPTRFRECIESLR